MDEPKSALEDPRLKAAVYVVEATSFERHSLWLQHSSEAAAHRWGEGEEEWSGRGGSGWLVEVGTLAGFPVNMHVSFDSINGGLVLFWEGVSRVVDSEMLEAWLRE